MPATAFCWLPEGIGTPGSASGNRRGDHPGSAYMYVLESGPQNMG